MTHRTEFPESPEVAGNRKDRYFALIIRVPAEQAEKRLGSDLQASTVLGNMAEHAPVFLPESSRIIRSIELTEDFAINGIR